MRIIRGRITVASRIIGMDTPTQKKSIAKLRQLEGVEYIFTAHTNYKKLD